MLQYYYILKDCTLFRGLVDEEITQLLSCVGAYTLGFHTHDVVRYDERRVTEIGVVLSGVLYMTKSHASGDRIILGEVTVGKTFGESLAFTKDPNSPILVSAATDCEVLFLPVLPLTTKNKALENLHERIMQNLLALMAEKIMLLQIKNDILSQKTTRDKLLMYFSYEGKTAGSKKFKIHYSREELSDFLSLNANALSRELGKMRDEGILSFKKNKFMLKDKK